ncbi:MAG: hypothetical protein AAFR55_04825 [Pseudomonadota bacterium]
MTGASLLLSDPTLLTFAVVHVTAAKTFAGCFLVLVIASAWARAADEPLLTGISAQASSPRQAAHAGCVARLLAANDADHATEYDSADAGVRARETCACRLRLLVGRVPARVWQDTSLVAHVAARAPQTDAKRVQATTRARLKRVRHLCALPVS